MKTKVLLYSLVALLFAACSDNEVENTPPVEISLTQSEQMVANGQNTFGFKLLCAAIENEKSPNAAISPYSVSQVLAMLANGASGETLSEIIEALGNAGANIDEINSYYKKLNDGLAITDKSTKFEFVNAIWASPGYSFNSDFKKTNSEYYGAALNSFATYEEIVGWYKNNAPKDIHSSIAELLNGKHGAYNSLTVNNTVYFNGKWHKCFSESTSKDNKFHGENGTTDAKMMTVHDTFTWYSGTHCNAIEIEYGNRAYSMMVVLPNEESSTAEVLDDLCKNGYGELTKSHNNLTVITMPKFEFARTANLQSILNAMGLTHIQPGEYPNVGDNGFSISQFEQNMYVNVNEEGTVVKATTSAGGVTAPLNEFFLVDRPFIWFIKENSTNTILFLGKVGAV